MCLQFKFWTSVHLFSSIFEVTFLQLYHYIFFRLGCWDWVDHSKRIWTELLIRQIRPPLRVCTMYLLVMYLNSFLFLFSSDALDIQNFLLFSLLHGHLRLVIGESLYNIGRPLARCHKCYIYCSSQTNELIILLLHQEQVMYKTWFS